MRKQDYLVNLIAAMGANEKRYFKLFSGLQPGEKRYLKLFDALENKKKYESAELCAGLGIEPWQLADDKHYLTQTLLQSLHNYDQESTELNVLRNNKENAQSLIARRMFNFALDIVEKTLERAWALNAFELIGALLLLRSSCRQNMGVKTETDNTIKEYDKAAICLREVIELMDLRSKARILESNAAPKPQFKKIITHPLIKGGVNKLNSLRAKSLWYETIIHYYSTTLDDPTKLKLAHEERKLYLAQPEIKNFNPIVYFTNLVRLASGEEDFEARQRWIGLLQKELANTDIKINSQRRDSILWSSQIMSLWNLRHLHRFKEAWPIARHSYSQAQGRMEYLQFSAAFEYALVALHNNEAGKAADAIEKLLSFKTDIRADMQPFVRLMQLMAQLALGNYSLVPHTIKATRFWLKKRAEAGNTEMAVFLKYAGLIAKAPLNKREAWLDLYKEIEAGGMPTIVHLLQLDVWVKAMIKEQRK